MTTVRRSRRIERAGVNALRTLLEDQDHIVQEIDGGNDHGEDLYVILTRNGRRTGHVCAIQVKSGKKYKRARGYAIPVEDHYSDWTESRIPVLGVVYDPEKKELYWTNLTKRLLGNESSTSWVQISLDARLSAETLRGFSSEVESFIDGSGMRIRSKTDEEIFAGAVRARSGVDPNRAPNPLYEGLAEIALRHEEKIDRALRAFLRSIPLVILVGVMIFEWPYQVRFVTAHSNLSPILWIGNLYIFMFYMALTMFFEFRAGRIPIETSRWFALIVGNFLWIPIWDRSSGEGWWATTWILAGSIVPTVGYKWLFVSFIRFAVDRKKRAREADSPTQERF